MTAPFTLQIGLLLATVLAAVVLFSQDRIPVDVTALGLLLFLIVTGLLPAEAAFDGFGSDVFAMLLGLLIMMAALTRTGVTDMVGRMALTHISAAGNHLLLLVMVSVVLMSSLMSNTATTAFFLPVLIGLARHTRSSPGKLLMPLAFAAILASSITLIGTSTNIVVSGLMEQYGLAPLAMLELAPVGIPIAAVGIAYMLTLGQKLIPDRTPIDEMESMSSGIYITEILISADSNLAGKSLEASRLGRDLDLNVLQIRRAGQPDLAPTAETELQGGDILLVEGKRESILGVKATRGMQIRPDTKFSLTDLPTGNLILTDAIIPPGSAFVGHTLAGLHFRNIYNVQVLAVQRHGRTFTRKLSELRLRLADVLVLQGDLEHIEALERQGLCRLLRSTGPQWPNHKRAWIAMGIFAATLVTATAGVLSLPVAMLVGALLVFATRCITPEEAYRSVNWTMLILIASMLGLGAAMESTGAADFLAIHIVGWVGTSHPAWLLTGFFALTVALTQPMSNQAAAAVVLPIAVQTAERLALNPRAFAVIIALAASCSFLTPLEPSCLLVYGPGRYRFSDFLKVGAPLTLLIAIVSVVLTLILWPVL